MTFARFWDWIDKRQIDRHLVCISIFYGLWRVQEWAMAYANAHADGTNGVGIAAIIAAVTAPFCGLSGYAMKSYFDARGTPNA